VNTALHRIDAGETVVDPALIAELVETPRRVDPLVPLTPREREVLALVAEGRTDRGIAEALWVTPRTAEAHGRNIFRNSTWPPHRWRTDVSTPCSLPRQVKTTRRRSR
jgi:DNA-binding NarL/FixJ family response regulator